MRHLFPLCVFPAFLIFLTACTTPTPQVSRQTTFYTYRFDRPAFVEYSNDFQPVRETPFSVPPSCGLLNTFPAPIGTYILIELSCPNGPAVLFLDSTTGALTQPITDSDSHFLAWAADGKSAVLKIDSLGNAHIARVEPDGKSQVIPIPEFTYDLATRPGGQEFTFTFSRGLGQGSELWLAKQDGGAVRQLYADRSHYISFARYSPDGKQIAFIKIPDTQTPYTIGELWVISPAGGLPARKLANADAGHGYAIAWSPDGTKIAFVVRENPDDPRADQSPESLISHIEMVDVKSGALTQITHLENGHVETPLWSPDGNTLAFNAVINDRMQVQIADLTTGEIRSLDAPSTCCPAWIQN